MQLKQFFRIPTEIQAEFWQDTLRRNRLSLLVICIMIFGMELFNMLRVLLWSASGLSTVNNRIYFTLYFLLWMAAAVYLLLRWLLRRGTLRIQWTVQYGMALFALCWHAGINAYDLNRNPEAETAIFVTAMLGLAVFIQMPAAYSLAAYVLSYGLFMGAAGGVLSSGKIINLTFTAIVSMAVSVTSFRHAVVTVCQRREIDQMNQRLQELVQRDPLTGLMNAAAFRHRVESYLASAKTGSEISVLILDLDDFKRVNDIFGHPCGDCVLQGTAVKLQTLFSKAIDTARIGGDGIMLALEAASPH